jgi:succinoglycan biosynthesis protein ExoA
LLRLTVVPNSRSKCNRIHKLQNPDPISQNGSDCVVVIPALNEEACILGCVDSLLRQTVGDFEIVVADGGSTDRTRALVAAAAESEPRLRVVENPGRLQSRALNLVAEQAAPSVKWLIRADAHTTYPPNFVEALLAAAQQTGASSVVVPMRTVGHDCFQRAAAAAQNSRLGNGGSLHRLGTSSRFVDHGHHALFQLGHFRRVGGYDEAFSHNEDFELDHRIRESGGTIWLTAHAPVDYIPRGSPRMLARQYFLHGQGRARTIMKHGLIPKIRQVLPVAVLGCYVIGIGVSPWVPVGLLLPLAHLMVCLAAGAMLGWRARDLCVAASGICAAIMHLFWAVGFCTGLVRYLRTYWVDAAHQARPNTRNRAAEPS